MLGIKAIEEFKRRQQKIKEQLKASQEESNPVDDFVKGYSTCNDLENALNKVNRKLADQFNLNDTQIKAYNVQKTTLEEKIKNEKCLEQKQQAYNENLQKLSMELAIVETQAQEKQKKLIRNVLIGVGGLAVVVIVIKLFQK